MKKNATNESVLSLYLDGRKAKKQGPEAVKKRQRKRLAELVAFARAHSPYYHELYQGLPEKIEDLNLLPITDKKKLMARFDDWATDREITVDKAQKFVGNLNLIGERFLGKYVLITTSGTTGTPGIFVVDEKTLAVTQTMLLRWLMAWQVSLIDIAKVIFGRFRTAMICATGGHYAEVVAANRMRKGSKRRAKAIRVFSVDMPTPELVAQLNKFRPTLLSPYASIGALLASEQDAGRLQINPALVVLSAEGLPLPEYDRIANAFKTKVLYSYAATECMFIGPACEHHWLHVNADWVLLEPVDADYRATPPGVMSHTVLVTNLANKTQPIIRYDLGDRIMLKPEPCSCGNTLPAIRVLGRTADVLTFKKDNGEKVSIPALVLELDLIPGVEKAQIVQISPTNLQLRLRLAADADSDYAWQIAEANTKHLLKKRGLNNVAIERSKELPEQSAGGKYRSVI
ncbi:coenzyme F390 synthetase [Legionella jordanis]|uniref:Coenzyme F390 synthetase n=1 Tax=Legionella jordanis TaxID=456 RepID=A0A0W0VBF1_9GAMM|nr:CoF synthetase [Legionella jordanis]KTD17458.1 coenzyme F390 synthetase [Legionella jordanis]VEH13427.1 Coenzyme F390 synthetase [Legionella jordanis]